MSRPLRGFQQNQHRILFEDADTDRNEKSARRIYFTNAENNVTDIT